MALAGVWSERKTRRMPGSVANDTNDANKCAAEHPDKRLADINTNVSARDNQRSISDDQMPSRLNNARAGVRGCRWSWKDNVIDEVVCFGVGRGGNDGKPVST